MLFRLHPDYPTLFPDPELAEDNGLLAMGGDLTPERLLAAYHSGIFPWYSGDQPLLWWSPDPRCVILPEHFRIPRTIRKELRACRFTASYDQAFEAVMRACANMTRTDQDGTWIVEAMITAYNRLHQQGFAHSVEIWDTASDTVTESSSFIMDGKQLVGGLYGIALGRAFFGESMFHTRTDASKLALVQLMGWLKERECQLVDCQMQTTHIMRYGASLISRTEFLQRLREALL